MAEIYDRFATIVYSIALRVLCDPVAAEEVMQDVFLQIWQNPDVYIIQRGPFCAWLAVVTRNRAIGRLRHRQCEHDLGDIVIASHIDFDDLAERKSILHRVRTIMGSLPADQQHVLDLACFEGRTHTEIAALTGEPVVMVRSHLRSALLLLRNMVNSSEDIVDNKPLPLDVEHTPMPLDVEPERELA